jgi:hypothetical protein
MVGRGGILRAVVVAALLGLGGGPGGVGPAVGGQEAAPGATATVPEPSACDVVPRDQAELRDLLVAGYAAGTPEAGRRGSGGAQPADEATVAAAEAATLRWLACVNGGDAAALLALYTDEAAGALLATALRAAQEGGSVAAGTPSAEQAAAFVAPLLVPSDAPPGRSGLLAVETVVVLPDGRVAATVEWLRVNEEGEEAQASTLLFRVEGEEYLIDEIVDVPEGAGR